MECLTWIDVAQSITALELITSRSWAVEGFSRPLDDTVQGCLAIWSKFNLFSGSMTRRPLSRSSQSFERKNGTRYWHLMTRSRSSSSVGASKGNVPLTKTYNTTPSDLKKKKSLNVRNVASWSSILQRDEKWFVNTVGIQKPTLRNLESFENWTFWRSVENHTIQTGG